MIFVIISCIFSICIFFPIYISDEIIISYGIHPFDICSKNPILWKYIKNTFIFTYIFSNIIFANFLFNNFFYNLFFKKNNKSKIIKNSININKINFSNDLNLLIGKDLKTNEEIYIPEKGLYQNFLITGTIGSGKTSSAMYPLTKQLF